MKLLLDTHLLIWAAAGARDRMSDRATDLIEDESNQLTFSAASIWEVAIKSGLARPGFDIDARLLRRGLMGAGYVELPVTGEHAAAVASLPSVHKDPFDRILLAQAQVEGLILLTADRRLADYGDPVRQV